MTVYRLRQPLSDDVDLFLNSLRDIGGVAHVLTDLARVRSYVTERAGRWDR